ncbi:CHAT domain-containing protein [Streptomyces sp. SAS_270]|uniref:CHAT domain-containing protein n=1 Tax=Streptomyces sp. SAS_270 TaxID=3412748 RepID=UPI00403C8BBB
MRDHLITALLDRVKRFDEQGDDSVLFETAASAEARELQAHLVQNDGKGGRVVSPAVLDALLGFHGARHQARPGSDGYADNGWVMRLLVLRARLRGEGVPRSFFEAVAAANERADEASCRARQLMTTYERTRAEEALDGAVHHYRLALDLSITGDDIPGLPMAHLSGALMRRFHLKGEASDLDEAIELRESSLVWTAEENPEQSRRLTLLSNLLLERHGRFGERQDLERAVSVGRAAVRATPVGSHARARRLSQLGRALNLRHELTDDIADLQEAIGHARAAVEEAHPEDPDRLDFAVRLARRLRARYDRLRDPADLEEPIELLDSLLDSASVPSRPNVMTELATALYFRHERTGDLADLDRAIALEKQALKETSRTDPDRGRRLANLAASHRIRYDRRGSVQDLEGAIRLGTEAVSVTREDGFVLSNLGLAFLLRYKRLFEAADLDRAIRLTTRAVDALPAVSPSTHRAMAMCHLAEALRARLRDDHHPADLDGVIRWQREAAATIPRSHPEFGRYLSALSVALLARFRLAQSPDDLDEAIRTAEQAVAVTARTHPSYETLLGCLAEALTDGPEPGADALDRAVDLARQAASTVRDDDIFLPRVWRRLGDMLGRRHDHRGDPGDLREAIRWWQLAAELRVATPTDRMECCAAWGSAAARLGDHALAAEGYDRAALLLHELAWHGLPRAARENHLTEWSGLAPAAAACHILAGAPERAVELLEQGRTIIQNQLLHTRGDMSELAVRAPALAAELLRVRERLDVQRSSSRTDPAELPDESLLSPLGRERLAQERAALCREWDDLVAEARQLDGFAYFLAPVPYEELSIAAEGGPVVVVNVSAIACHALVIRAPGSPVEVVDLPGLTEEEAARQVVTFLNVLAAREKPRRAFLRREADRHAVYDLLAWLWERIAEPVLDHLGALGRPGDPLPRVWWCPTNRLALLPLHSAGRYPRHRTSPGTSPQSESLSCVPARAVSSYISTLTALRRARERGEDGGGFGGLLAVGMPQTPGRPPLPEVEREYEELRARFPRGAPVNTLIGPDATCEAVRRALHESSWAHFACHAEQDFMDPAHSAFVLYDGRLAATELLELDLPRAELAYLSACETATGAVNLPDEVMHLASTMQLAGYRHVLATMWSIEDGSAPDVAAQVYAALTRAGRPDAGEAARALHAAVAAHRGQHPTDPLRWAAYLHVGP